MNDAGTTNTKTAQKSSTGFLCLPSFLFASHIALFLDGEDVLSMRCVSLQMKGLVDEEASVLWPAFLQNEFRYTTNDHEEQQTWKALKVIPSSMGPSVFGTCASDALMTLQSPFEAWMQWKRASWRYSGGRCDFQMIAPYFIQAADIWARLEEWASQQGNDKALFEQFFFTRGLTLERLAWPDSVKTLPTVQPAQAILAFYGKQVVSNAKGLFGGHRVYYFETRTYLIGGWSESSTAIEFACSVSNYNEVPFLIDPYTGKIRLKLNHSMMKVCASDDADSLFDWFGEFVARLETGFYRWGNTLNDGIQLFPQLVGRGATRAVTRGVEVIASAIHTPTAERRFTFVYSIRLRLVAPNQDGYAENRGFDTCQLISRHWRLRYRDGRTESVDGHGVVGLFPLLREGSHRRDYEDQSSAAIEVGEDVPDGTFQYESCTDGSAITFGGFLVFLPGSLVNATGPPFEVHLAPFQLDANPEYHY